MDRKFICDECPNIYSSRQGRWRHKKNEHAKSVPCHSYTSQCKNQVKGGDLETNDTLREIMKMLKLQKMSRWRIMKRLKWNNLGQKR